MDAVYGELRRMARGYLRRERASHSLPPTALVHEAYSEAGRSATRAMAEPRALLRHRGARDAPHPGRSRARHAHQRSGAGAQRVTLLDMDARVEAPGVDILALDVALEKLAAIDERQCRLVELRFFGGLTVEEAAAVLGVAPITVKRDWALARTWLYRELRGPAA